MSYFESLLSLPTIEISNGYQTPSFKNGTLGKLVEAGEEWSKVTFYAPDIGYPLRGDGWDDPDNYVTVEVHNSCMKGPQPLTALDRYVINTMLLYPLAAPTREAVLCGCFLSLGAGVSWRRDGTLGNPSDKKSRCLLPRPRIAYRNETGDDWHAEELYSRPALADLKSDALRKYIEDNITVNEEFRRRELFIDHLATHRSKYNLQRRPYEHASMVADLIEKGHIPLSDIPNNVEPSFLDGAIEIIDKVLVSTPGFPGYKSYLDEPVVDRRPEFIRKLAAEVEEEKKTTENPVTEEDSARKQSEIREIVWFLINHKDKIRNGAIKAGWALIRKAQRAFDAVGFDQKTRLDATNGSGWVGHYAPIALTDDDMALIISRLKRAGFKKNGLQWDYPHRHVTVRLVPMGTKYRADLLIITHPEDDPSWIVKLTNAFENGWQVHQDYLKSQTKRRKAGTEG